MERVTPSPCSRTGEEHEVDLTPETGSDVVLVEVHRSFISDGWTFSPPTAGSAGLLLLRIPHITNTLSCIWITHTRSLTFGLCLIHSQ